MSRSMQTAPALILSPLQPLPPVTRLLVVLAQKVLIWDLRRHGRRSLNRLDAHMLRDIGLTAEAAQIESAKPFWRA